MPKITPIEKNDPTSTLPLTPVVFSILVALTDGEKHGYAIMQTVDADTEGALKMGPGTLYGSIDRMLRAKLITETDGTGDEAPHRERRRYYRLTDLGRRAVRAELGRLELAVAVARRKKLTALDTCCSL